MLRRILVWIMTCGFLSLVARGALGGLVRQFGAQPARVFSNVGVARVSGKGRVYVLCVGIDRYRDDRLAPLRYAAADARAIAEAMRDRGAVANVLTDREATRAGMFEAIDRFAKLARPEDTLLFYFGGHALRDSRGTGYLATADTNIDRADQSTLGADALVRLLGHSQAAHQVILLDALAGVKDDFNRAYLGSLANDRSTSDRSRLCIGLSGRFVWLEGQDRGHALMAYAFLHTLENLGDEVLASRLAEGIDETMQKVAGVDSSQRVADIHRYGEDFVVIDNRTPKEAELVPTGSAITLKEGDRVLLPDGREVRVGSSGTLPATAVQAGTPLTVRSGDSLDVRILAINGAKATKDPDRPVTNVSVPDGTEINILGSIQPGDASRVAVLGKMADVIADQNGGGLFSIQVPIRSGDNVINLGFRKSDGSSEQFTLLIHNQVPSPDAPRHDRAILFGTNTYKNFDVLTNPIPDVQEMQKALEAYGFDVTVYPDASEDKILTVLDDLTHANYGPQDQVLIMFAGHGTYDGAGEFGLGYLIAADSTKDKQLALNRSLIDYGLLSYRLNNIGCPHLLVLIDACFGGAFTQELTKDRAVPATGGGTSDDAIGRLLKKTSRLYLTSGGKEYVPDSDGKGHSPFVNQILQTLEGSRSPILSIDDLQLALVELSARWPVPRGGRFGVDGGGTFLFVRKPAPASKRREGFARPGRYGAPSK